MKLKQVWLDAIDESVIAALQKALAVNYYGYEVKHILDDIAYLRKQLWILENVPEVSVVITELRKHPAGLELNIWSVGGEGYIKHMDVIYSGLENFATLEGCRWITGFVDRKGFNRLYKKYEPLKKYELWLKEL